MPFLIRYALSANPTLSYYKWIQRGEYIRGQSGVEVLPSPLRSELSDPVSYLMPSSSCVLNPSTKGSETAFSNLLLQCRESASGDDNRGGPSSEVSERFEEAWKLYRKLHRKFNKDLVRTVQSFYSFR